MSTKNLKVQINGPQTGQPYLLEHVDNNKNQADIVYTVIEKLKEWVEFPEKCKLDPTVTFNPLEMTVIGPGGTGKSFIIHVLRTAPVGTIFPKSVVSQVTAPTGAAANGVGGTTCHSFFKANVKNPDTLYGRKKLIQ
jgi:hypothetical protein